LKAKKLRKQEKNDNPEDVEGFLGPWGKFENEVSVAKPNEQERAELDELLSKRHKRGRIPEDKPLEEKSTLHSEYNERQGIGSICIKSPFPPIPHSQGRLRLPGPLVSACSA